MESFIEQEHAVTALTVDRVNAAIKTMDQA
jgi:hypothetical protein